MKVNYFVEQLITQMKLKQDCTRFNQIVMVDMLIILNSD